MTNKDAARILEFGEEACTKDDWIDARTFGIRALRDVARLNERIATLEQTLNDIALHLDSANEEIAAWRASNS